MKKQQADIPLTSLRLCVYCMSTLWVSALDMMIHRETWLLITLSDNAASSWWPWFLGMSPGWAEGWTLCCRPEGAGILSCHSKLSRHRWSTAQWNYCSIKLLVYLCTCITLPVYLRSLAALSFCSVCKLCDVAEDVICVFNETLLPVERLYDILGIQEPVLEKQTVQIALRTMPVTALIVQRA